MSPSYHIYTEMVQVSLGMYRSVRLYATKYQQSSAIFHSHLMMTSPNGSIFRVIVPLCGESISHRWFPSQRDMNAGLWCFFVVVVSLKNLMNKLSIEVIRDAKTVIWRRRYVVLRSRTNGNKVIVMRRLHATTLMWTFDVLILPMVPQ